MSLMYKRKSRGPQNRALRDTIGAVFFFADKLVDLSVFQYNTIQ